MSSPIKLAELPRDTVENLTVLHSDHVKSLQTANNILIDDLFALTDVPESVKAAVMKWNMTANAINAEVAELRFSILGGKPQSATVN